MVHLGRLSPTAMSLCHDAVMTPAFMGLVPLPRLGMLWGVGVPKGESKEWHEARRLNCPPVTVGRRDRVFFSAESLCL